jgi:hypothetical protein
MSLQGQDKLVEFSQEGIKPSNSLLYRPICCVTQAEGGRKEDFELMLLNHLSNSKRQEQIPQEGPPLWNDIDCKEKECLT